MKTRLNSLCRALYSDRGRFTINDIRGIKSMQRFSKGLMILLMLFISTGNAKASILNVPSDASIHNSIKKADSYEINLSEGNNVKTHPSAIQTLPVPVITWPTNDAHEYTVNPTLYWYLSGSTSDTVTYSVMVRDSTNPIYSGPGYFFIQGTKADSVIISDTLTPGATYLFIVVASFSGGDSTESTEESFTIDSSLGRAPLAIPTWPAGNATVFSPTPTLYWYLSSWTAGTLSYNIIVRDSTDHIVVTGAPISSPTVSLTLGTLKGGHTYSWRVETINETLSLSSGYSSAATFTVDASQGGAPAAILSWPIDSATVYSAAPALNWYLSSPASGAIQYIVAVTDTSNNPIVTDTTSNSYLNLDTTLLPGGTYKWRVETINGTASSGFSAPAIFKVDSSQGGAPQAILSWPVGNATVYTTVPSFSWYLSYGTVGTVNYDIIITDSLTHTLVSGSAFTSASRSLTLDSASALAPGHTYNWRVNVINGSQTSGYSYAGTFTVFGANENSGLPTPVASVPGDGNIIYSDTVQFFWYLNDAPPSEPYSYTIEIKSQSIPFDGVTPVSDSADNIVIPGITGSSYILTSPLLTPGTAYHWRVILIKGSDSSAWSDANVNGGALFSTNAVLESVTLPVIGAPDHQVLLSSSPSLSWYITTKPASDQTYSVELSSNSNMSNPTVYANLDSFTKKISGLNAGTYYWCVRASNVNGKYSDFSRIAAFTIKSITAVANKNNTVPNEFTVSQNYPNPFNPGTIINYSLPKSAFVTIKIYNILGQEVRTLINNQLQAGVYNVQWNSDNNFGQHVASGIYIYRVTAGQYIKSMKMILLK
jgi:hypothetical protein